MGRACGDEVALQKAVLFDFSPLARIHARKMKK